MIRESLDGQTTACLHGRVRGRSGWAFQRRPLTGDPRITTGGPVQQRSRLGSARSRGRICSALITRRTAPVDAGRTPTHHDGVDGLCWPRRHQPQRQRHAHRRTFTNVTVRSAGSRRQPVADRLPSRAPRPARRIRRRPSITHDGQRQRFRRDDQPCRLLPRLADGRVGHVGSVFTSPGATRQPARSSLTAIATDNEARRPPRLSRQRHGQPASNRSPTVSLTSPSQANATYTAPATIGIAATASDADGSIARVDFYRGSTLIGVRHEQSRTRRRGATWPPARTQLTAVARDNADAATTSVGGHRDGERSRECRAVRVDHLHRPRRDLHGAGQRHGSGDRQ